MRTARPRFANPPVDQWRHPEYRGMAKRLEMPVFAESASTSSTTFAFGTTICATAGLNDCARPCRSLGGWKAG